VSVSQKKRSWRNPLQSSVAATGVEELKEFRSSGNGQYLNGRIELHSIGNFFRDEVIFSGMETSSPASRRYQKTGKLGEGTYGIVYKGTDTVTGQTDALKWMKPDDGAEGIRATTLREMSILRSVSHPNVLELKDVIICPSTVMLVTDYLDYDLRTMLKRIRKPLESDLVCSYAFQLLCGILALHTSRIIHRDLKPENILLDSHGYLKIGDFGLSRYFTLPLRQYSPNVVSMWYRAPELLFGDKFYEISIDIWSIGCIIAEMTIGTPLFWGDSELDQLHKIFEVLGTPDSESLPNYDALVEELVNVPRYPKKDWKDDLKFNDPQLVDLLARILNFDPARRLTAQEALVHPYFDHLPFGLRKMCCPANVWNSVVHPTTGV
jgi:serine/threonine protein kinase